MANDELNTPVTIQASRIDATLLPKGFSTPFSLYLIQQGTDLGSVADKANQAAGGAYDAQATNDAQDKTLASHETRITNAEQELVNHESRIKAAETELADHEQRITAAETKLTDHENRLNAAESELTDHESRISANETELADHERRITENTNDISSVMQAQQADRDDIDNISNDYVSKQATALQSVSSPLGVTNSLAVNSKKVIGSQQTGWVLSTGTPNKAAFNADQVFTVNPTYTQEEIQAIVDALIEARQRIKALEDMASTHGLIAT